MMQPLSPQDQEGGCVMARGKGVSPGGLAGPQVKASAQDQSNGSMPWEALPDQEQAKVWLEGASAEELGAMAARLLADRPLSSAEEAVRVLVVSAANASEVLCRKLTSAMQAASKGQFRWRSQGPAEEVRA